jgi:hypothetical protein
MDGSRNQLACLIFTCVAGVLTGQEALAQVPLSPITATPGMGSPGMGSGFFPNSTYGPSMATATGSTSTPMLGTATQSAIFSNPLAAPFLLNSTSPSPNAQLGLLMLSNQQSGLGLGPQPLPGVRPAPPGGTRQSRARTQAQGMAPKRRGSVMEPAGLASRYFNRTTTISSPHPQSYYNRQNRYYP